MPLITAVAAVLDPVTDPLPHHAVPGVLAVAHVHLEAVTVEPLVTSILTLGDAVTHLGWIKYGWMLTLLSHHTWS